MSIKNLGLSLWTSSAAKSNASRQPKRLSQSEPTPVGFGLPSPEDPDPFGVKALELAGLEIKEAGSSTKPSVDAFEYKPSPTSPIFRISTQSLDLAVNSDLGYSPKRNSKRSSKRSFFSLRHEYSASDQRHSISATESISGSRNSISESRASIIPSPVPPTVSPTQSIIPSTIPSPTIATFAIDGGTVSSPVSDNNHSRPLSLKSAHIQLPETINEAAEEQVEEESEDDLDDFDDEEGDIIVEEISTSAAPVVPTVLAAPIAVKAKVVTLKRRGPPALPLKSPLRPRFFGSPTQRSSTQDQDEISSTYSLSPEKSSFDRSEFSNPWSEQTSLQDNESDHHKDIGLEIMSSTDRENPRKSPVTEEEMFEDAKETTPIATISDSILSSHSAEVSEETTKDLNHDKVAEPESSQPEGLIHADTPKVEHDLQSTSEHKSSISGSTLASITENPSFIKSSSEQSLANLIKQGLQSTLANESDHTSPAMHHYYDAEEVSSDYEDDGPVSPTSPAEQIYLTPGSFESEPIH